MTSTWCKKVQLKFGEDAQYTIERERERSKLKTSYGLYWNPKCASSDNVEKEWKR